jgi:hypothetical protein
MSGFHDVSRIPGIHRYMLGIQSIIEADNDPENTLQVALTQAELACCVFCTMLGATMFPELAIRIEALTTKLAELSDAQQFLPRGEEDA